MKLKDTLISSNRGASLLSFALGSAVFIGAVGLAGVLLSDVSKETRLDKYARMNAQSYAVFLSYEEKYLQNNPNLIANSTTNLTLSCSQIGSPVCIDAFSNPMQGMVSVSSGTIQYVSAYPVVSQAVYQNQLQSLLGTSSSNQVYEYGKHIEYYLAHVSPSLHVAVSYPNLSSATLVPLGSGTISTSYIMPTPSYNITAFATVMEPIQSVKSISVANPGVSPQTGQATSPTTYQAGPIQVAQTTTSSTSYSTTPITCPAGTAFDASTGSCTQLNCPAGEQVSGNQCVSSCSGGQQWNGTQCVCPSGETWNGSQCVSPSSSTPQTPQGGPPPPPTCPSGETWNGSQCSSLPYNLYYAGYSYMGCDDGSSLGLNDINTYTLGGSCTPVGFNWTDVLELTCSGVSVNDIASAYPSSSGEYQFYAPSFSNKEPSVSQAFQDCVDNTGWNGGYFYVLGNDLVCFQTDLFCTEIGGGG